VLAVTTVFPAAGSALAPGAASATTAVTAHNSTVKTVSTARRKGMGTDLDIVDLRCSQELFG
jgi:hypothetical protein